MADNQSNKHSRLKSIRIQLGLSSSDFARAAGIDPRNYSSIESGKRSVGEKIFRNICKAFPAVSINWLLTGEGEMLRQRNTGINNSVVVGVGDNNQIFHGEKTEYKHTSDNDKVIAAVETKIQHLNSILAEKNKLIEDQQTEIKHLKSILEEKDKLLAEKNKLIEEKERLIKILLEKNS